MLVVDIKVNEELIHRYTAVRLEEFKGHGATHKYEVQKATEERWSPTKLRWESPGSYLIGHLRHRYCAGATSLARKMMNLATAEGMDK